MGKDGNLLEGLIGKDGKVWEARVWGEMMKRKACDGSGQDGKESAFEGRGCL